MSTTITITREEYDMLVSIVNKSNNEKMRRSQAARKYFENHKQEIYQRQKQWRDASKEKINARRRYVYKLKKDAEKKLLSACETNDIPAITLALEEAKTRNVKPQVIKKAEEMIQS